MKLTNIFKFTVFTCFVSAASVQAAQYVLTSGNVFDGISDQVVIIDNAGMKTPLSEGNATASLGYFNSSSINSNPLSVSNSSLASDFVTLATSDFGENSGFNGFFSISNTITDAESSVNAINGNGKKLYLFLGDKSSLLTSNYIGLVDTGLIVPDVQSGSNSYSSNADFSQGAFTTLGTPIYGEATLDNVLAGSGITSNGAFQLVAIPEPSSSALLGLSGLALILRRRR